MRRMRKKSYERLEPENIARVIGLLESETPITKKQACEELNISYNTTRLQKIIDEHREYAEFVARRKAANRGKAASADEIQTVIKEYLQGEAISNIAKSLYRSSGFVKSIVLKVGIPAKTDELVNGVDVLPEQCVRESFEEGEHVWSARHQSLAIIEKELSMERQKSLKGYSLKDYEKNYSSKVYSIYVLDSGGDYEDTLFPGVSVGGFQAYSPAYELGSLKHLEALGVDIRKIA